MSHNEIETAPAMTAKTAAEAAVAHDPEMAAKRDEALAQGHVDEICGKCGTLLMAHHHFVRCDEDPCAMRSPAGKTVFEMLGMAS